MSAAGAASGAETVDAISVIFTSRDDPWLFRALDSMRAISPAGLDVETVVVLHASPAGYTERVLAAAADFGRAISVCALDRKPSTIAEARNCGAHAARHETLWFLDSDCVIAPDALDSLIGRPNRIANGRIVFEPNGSGFSRQNCLLRTIGYRGLRGRLPYMPNLLVSRKLFTQIGGFRPDLSCGEDFELGDRLVRAGHVPEFLPGLSVTHLDDQHRAKTIKNWYRNGRGGGLRSLLAPSSERQARRPLFLLVPEEWLRHGPGYATVSLLGTLVLSCGYHTGRIWARCTGRAPAAVPPAHGAAPAWVWRAGDPLPTAARQHRAPVPALEDAQ
jgi:Glycosyl transferase family 2